MNNKFAKFLTLCTLVVSATAASAQNCYLYLNDSSVTFVHDSDFERLAPALLEKGYILMPVPHIVPLPAFPKETSNFSLDMKQSAKDFGGHFYTCTAKLKLYQQGRTNISRSAMISSVENQGTLEPCFQARAKALLSLPDCSEL